MSRARIALGISAVAFGVFLVSAAPVLPHHIDPLTNTLTAWSIGNNGSVYLDDWSAVSGPDFYAQSNQIVEGRGHPVSKYPPGTAILAAPLYRIFGNLDTAVVEYETPDGTKSTEMPLPALWPSVFVGSATSAAAVGVFFLVFDKLARRRTAVLAALTVAFGTPLWTIASSALWQHGPAAVCIALGCLALANNRQWLAGFAFSPILLIRPQAAIAIAILGLALGLLRRSLVPIVQLGLPTAASAMLYLGFNLIVFGDRLPIVAGGYALGGELVSTSRLAAVTRSFFDRYRGVFIYSPFVAVSFPAMVIGRKSIPDWAWSAIIGGLGLLLFQVRAGDFSGGTGFFGYRYPIESLMFALPAMVAGLDSWLGEARIRQLVLVSSALLAVAIHAVGALT